MANDTTIKITVPRSFVIDHIERDLAPESIVTRETKTTLEIEVTPDQLQELESDARYYYEMRHGMDGDPACRRALTLLRSLAKKNLLRLGGEPFTLKQRTA
jgi:hypothetical protein